MNIILYIDEFTRTSPSKDAMLSLLKKMGYSPIIFNGVSGRTMLSMGMLRWARRVIASNLRRLEKYGDAEIIFLEPSAWSVFRDEAFGLIDTESLVLSPKSFVLYDDWLLHHSDLLNLSPLTSDLSPKSLVLLHEHCHQMALNPIGLSQRLLSLIPDTSVIRVGDSCCGMAGAFGYLKQNYELSMQIGKPLFDEINAYPNAIVSAPGVSCQKQILDGTGRTAFHPVELINMSFK